MGREAGGSDDLDELIEDDATLASEETDTGDDAPQQRRKVFTSVSDPPINALHARCKSGDLVLEPLFQRRRVWEDARASRLIESVLLEVPLPVFYLAEGPDGTDEVIDGQQRLNSFFRFLDNGYALRGLRTFRELNGKFFKDLERPLQKLVRDSSVRTITFKKESDEALRFEIFERLNTGAVPLNSQEIRNCVYRGAYNKALVDLSADPEYRVLMRLNKPEKRMRDVEYVLRFAAFFHATYLNYRPPMARFLSQDMLKHRNAAPAELDALRAAFKNSVALTRSVFGEHAFRRFYRGKQGAIDGKWEPKQFNSSLFDIVMWSFAKRDKNAVMGRLDAVRESLIVLMTDDPEFIESIELSTSSARMVTTRFDRWRMALDAVLDGSPKQPRTFSRTLKEALYRANPTCSICGQRVADVDDSAVDHVEQYWAGGKTIPENARLTHRYCNWARPKNDPLALMRP